VTTVFDIVDVVLEKHFPHLEEGSSRQQGITACLMLWSDPLQIQLISDLVSGLDQGLDKHELVA
jgi:hypothetical protein